MNNKEIYEKIHEECKLRALSPETEKEYQRGLRGFVRYHDNRPIDEMGENEIRRYLLHMAEIGRASGTINIHNSGLRFVYGAVLGKTLNYQQIPRRRIHRELPKIMSKAEIVKFFSVIDNLRDKAIFETIYGGGLRISEITRLRVQDIDSAEMRIFVHILSEAQLRHCPKCQTLNKELWIENRKNDLLNVGCFHVVFTVPSELNTTIYRNQEICYNILFKAVSETLKELCSDRKYLGAQTGFTSIFHTWGQNLCFHPHIHCVLPGGGINSSGKWRNSRKKKFFLPVKVLSKVFRRKFLYHFRNAKLDFVDESISFQSLIDLGAGCLLQAAFQDRRLRCRISMLSFAQPRYTHRIAISNNRILAVKNGMVTFKRRDYKDNSNWKIMTLSAVEFIRRFLMHTLPHGFTKIRHFGFLAGRSKFAKVNLCKLLTGTELIMRNKLSIFFDLRKTFWQKALLSLRLGQDFSFPTTALISSMFHISKKTSLRGLLCCWLFSIFRVLFLRFVTFFILFLHKCFFVFPIASASTSAVSCYEIIQSRLSSLLSAAFSSPTSDNFLFILGCIEPTKPCHS